MHKRTNRASALYNYAILLRYNIYYVAYWTPWTCIGEPSKTVRLLRRRAATVKRLDFEKSKPATTSGDSPDAFCVLHDNFSRRVKYYLGFDASAVEYYFHSKLTVDRAATPCVRKTQSRRVKKSSKLRPSDN